MSGMSGVSAAEEEMTKTKIETQVVLVVECLGRVELIVSFASEGVNTSHWTDKSQLLSTARSQLSQGDNRMRTSATAHRQSAEAATYNACPLSSGCRQTVKRKGYCKYVTNYET